MDMVSGIPSFYLIAAVFGALGQSIRGILGVIKAQRRGAPARFRPGFFVSSLALGMISGLLGALAYDLPGTSPSDLTLVDVLNDRNFLLMAIAAGYFGADVIEGVLGRGRPPSVR